MILGMLDKGYCKKNRVLELLAKIFGYVASAPLKENIPVFISNAISGHGISFEIKHTIKHNFRLKLGKS